MLGVCKNPEEISDIVDARNLKIRHYFTSFPVDVTCLFDDCKLGRVKKRALSRLYKSPIP